MKKFALYFTGICVMLTVAAFLVTTNTASRNIIHDSSAITSFPMTQAGWYATVTYAIENSEYAFSNKDTSGYEAVNRSIGLRFRFREGNFTVLPRTADTWQASLTVKDIYCDEHKLNTATNRTELNDKGLFYFNDAVRIQYINDENGMRQNFIIAAQPETTEKITVELAINSELEKKLHQNSLILKNGKTEVYRYTDLLAMDAAGKKLNSAMQLHDDVLALVVDTKDAAFPVTIDPLSTTPSWKVQSDQVGAHMGFSVSQAGDVNNDGYDDVIVGSLTFDAGEFDEGRAFVYLGSATGLSTTAIWQYESNNVGALFGKAVAGAGDINGDGYDDILVGAGDYSGPESLEGKAYMFYGNSTGVNASPDWTYESNQVGAAMAYPLETLGDANGDGFADIIVGCNSFDNPETDEGVAYIFYGSAAGLNATPDLTLDESNENCRYGHSVSSAGDVNGDGYDDALVGGYNCSSGLAPDAGACFLYYGSSAGIVPTSVWSIYGDQENALLGFWCHGVGDVNNDGYADVMLGAKRYDNPEEDEGKAWLYLGSATGLSTTPAWSMESNNADAEYANQFSGAGDVNGDGFDDVVMGAHFYTNTFGKEGAAYVYLGGPTGLSLTPYWTVYGGGSQINLGWSADGAGDINHDGFDDIIIGLYKYAEGQTDEGAAEAFYGSTDCTPITSYAVSATTSTTATVTWTLNPYASIYKIYAKGNGESHVYVTATSGYTMTGLTPGKKYKTWIQSKCGSGWSMRSNVVNVILPMKLGVQNGAQTAVYPNPARDEIYFNMVTTAESNAHIFIYNTAGELVKEFYYEKDDMADKLVLDISDLNPALYFYSVQTLNGLSTGNFIKN